MLATESPKAEFHTGLQDVVWPLVKDVDTTDYKAIHEAVKQYVAAQTHIKPVPKKLYSNEILLFIVGQKVICDEVKWLKRQAEKGTVIATLEEFKRRITVKLDRIGLFYIKIPPFCLVVIHLMVVYGDYIKKEYNKIYPFKCLNKKEDETQ